MKAPTKQMDQHLCETFGPVSQPAVAPKKVLILGHGRNGKDTAAEILNEMYGYTYISSSRAMLDEIYPALTWITGIEDKEELFEKRSESRELWKRLIDLYNAADKAALAKLISQKTDVYVGMRSDVEYAASKHLFDVVLWIDASDRVASVDPTMMIQYDEHEMYWVDNNYPIDSIKGLKHMLFMLRDVGVL